MALQVAFQQRSQAQTNASLTFEPLLAASEEASFDNVDQSRVAGEAHSGQYSARVTQGIGPSKQIQLEAGEKLQVNVFGHVEAEGKHKISFLPLPVLGDVPAGGENGKRKLAIKGGVLVPLNWGHKKSDQPAAYLEIVASDTSGKVVHSERKSLSHAATESWEELSIDYQASSKETVVIQLVNPSDLVTTHFDDLTISQEPPLIVQENHYDPWGWNLAGIEVQGSPDHKWQYINREKQTEFGINYLDLQARMYDPVLGRFFAIDPLPDTEGQESMSTYQYGWNNPVNKSDPDGKCPTCPAAAVGAVLGALIGGGIEAGIQLYQHGEIKDWKAVGGAALQGGITGGVAGLTGGLSLGAQVAVGAGANIAGGIANKQGVQGKPLTAKQVVVDGAVGGVAGAAGYGVNKLVQARAAAKASTANTTEKAASDLVRVRHHTGADQLKGIKNSGTITAARGKPYGVDVEVAPFVKPAQANMGQANKGAYVEFDASPSQLLTPPPGYMGGTGNAARIVTEGKPLPIQNANPQFVKWKWF